MSNFLVSHPVLLKLSSDVKAHSDKLDLEKKCTTKTTKPALSEEQAARVIQHAWRGQKTKEALVKNPYHTYLSMMDSTEEQRQLSAIMYGRHVAEIQHSAKERIDNPQINTREYYHRSTPLSNAIIDTLFKEFDIPNFDPQNHTYIPVTLLRNNPIEDVLKLFSRSIPGLQLIKNNKYSIAVLAIPNKNQVEHNKLKEKIKNMGLIASFWEIAENLRTKLEPPYSQHYDKVRMSPNLPQTKEALLNSEIMIHLNGVATSGNRYPTKILAKCLQRLLKGAPSTISPQAIQRIAVMLDVTNTFYKMNYPRYALCVYTILHELSLALLKNTDKAALEQEYKDFKEESEHSLANILGLDKSKMTKSTFFTAASTSGAGACAVAMRIVSKMTTADGERPKVKICKPCYYELPNTFSLQNTEYADEADILMISAGPIVNPEGLTPGVDINSFIRRHVINNARTKPVAIIIDATTALYKNIRLAPDVIELVEQGKISIIIHESHQKFGLIHSDQAQYGRVLSWCSNEHFTKSRLTQFKKNAKHDFVTRIDIRIGAFISAQCGELLEAIKKKHFASGAILRNMLLETSLISKHLEQHEDMLDNEDELYFLNDQELVPGSYTSNLERAAFGIIDYRASFGHYAPTTTGVIHQRRLSPDASDNIDALLQASHIRLSKAFGTHQMMRLISTVTPDKEQLPLEQQIVLLSMLHNISTNTRIFPQTFGALRVITHLPTDKDIREIIDPSKNPKDLLFIQTAGQKERLAFCSHDNRFRQIEINDPQIIAMITNGTMITPQARTYIKTFLHNLQAKAFPAYTNFSSIYAAMSHALESCPLLSSRPCTANVKTWLGVLQDKIVQRYQPKNPLIFLEIINSLYAMNISLKDNELHVLANHPEIYKVIKGTNVDESAMKVMLIFMMTIEPTPEQLVSLLKNKDFIRSVLKVYEGNEKILAGLSDAPVKHRNATLSSKAYIKNCFTALYEYHTVEKPNKDSSDQLISSIKNAEQEYLKVLSQDRNVITQLARYTLQAITNFIAALTFGIAHYIHYKNTKTVTFFSGTNSENKLKQLDNTLIEGIEREQSLASS